MSITTTWSINTLERRTSDGYVTGVHYDVVSTDGTYNSRAYGSVGLNGDLVTPYASITEEMAVGWVQEALGQQIPETDEDGVVRTASTRTAMAVSQVEDALAAQIQEQVAPTTATGTPWN